MSVTLFDFQRSNCMQGRKLEVRKELNYMHIVSGIPREWAKVRPAARTAGVPITLAKALIISGAIPVAIDGGGYMWVSADALRNGTNHVRQAI
jgi:hypothetical protein